MVRSLMKPAIFTASPSFWHSDVFRKDLSTSEHVSDLAQELKLTWNSSRGYKQSSLANFLDVFPV